MVVVVIVVVGNGRSGSATRTHVRLLLLLLRVCWEQAFLAFLLQWRWQIKMVETVSSVVLVEGTGASSLGRGAVVQMEVVQQRWWGAVKMVEVAGDEIQVREEGGQKTLAVAMLAQSKV